MPIDHKQFPPLVNSPSKTWDRFRTYSDGARYTVNHATDKVTWKPGMENEVHSKFGAVAQGRESTYVKGRLVTDRLDRGNRWAHANTFFVVGVPEVWKSWVPGKYADCELAITYYAQDLLETASSGRFIVGVNVNDVLDAAELTWQNIAGIGPYRRALAYISGRLKKIWTGSSIKLEIDCPYFLEQTQNPSMQVVGVDFSATIAEGLTAAAAASSWEVVGMDASLTIDSD